MPTQSFDHTLFNPNADHDIPARVEKPETAAPQYPVPALVMLHGTGTQKDEVASFTRSFAS
jgi:dienelactone hydrolase